MHIRSVSLAFVLSLAGVMPAQAQSSTTIQDSLAAAAKQLESLTGDVKKRSPKGASAVAEAVEALRVGAAAAAKNVESLRGLVAESAAGTSADIKASSDAMLKSLQALTASADTVAVASTTSAAALDEEPSRAGAGRAATQAAFQARQLASAVKETATLASTMSADMPPAAAAAVGRVVVQKADSALATTVTLITEGIRVGRESLDPTVPALGEGDQGVLEALRVRLTGGAIFFNGTPELVKSDDKQTASIRSTQFGQAATYLAFEAQPRLWGSELGPCVKERWLPGIIHKNFDRRQMTRDCKAERNAAADRRGYSRVYGDPLVAVRLTTIPVAGAKPQSLSVVETPAPATFLQSQKAAQVQLGLLTSVNFGGFSVNDARFHWGLGPIARFGLQSVTDSQRAVRVWDLDNDLFKMPSGGVRLSLYEKSRRVAGTRQNGWAPAAYLDVSVGLFENFETATGRTAEGTACLENPPACLLDPPARDAFVVSKPTRTYVEGRIFLEYVYLGVDLNTGRGPDDLRFIAGLTMTLDQFFGRRKSPEPAQAR